MTDCAEHIRHILLQHNFKIRSKGDPVSISRGMMETMRETPHGNSIPSFSTSPLPSQTRLEQRAQVREKKLMFEIYLVAVLDIQSMNFSVENTY